jgi:hypothetical protein
MVSLHFISIPGGTRAGGAWLESNQALGRLIALHHSRLDRCIRIAGRIQAQLAAIFPCMDGLCAETCPDCRQRCCNATRVWFDFRDLLFFHLTRQPIPPNQLVYENERNCCYLATDGCRLPRSSRPWACTRYLCPAQLAIVDAAPDEFLRGLTSTLDGIHDLRLDLEDAFLQGISKPGFF